MTSFFIFLINKGSLSLLAFEILKSINYVIENLNSQIRTLSSLIEISYNQSLLESEYAAYMETSYLNKFNSIFTLINNSAIEITNIIVNKRPTAYTYFINSESTNTLEMVNMIKLINANLTLTHELVNTTIISNNIDNIGKVINKIT